MNLFSTGKFGDLADSQRLARVSLFTSLVLMTMVLVLTWSRETDNATVVVNDRSRIALSIQQQLHSLIDNLADWATPTLSNSPNPRPRAVRRPSSVERVFLVDLATGAASMEQPGFDTPADYARFAPLLRDTLEATRFRYANALRGPVDADQSGKPPNGVLVMRDRAVTGITANADKAYATVVIPVRTAPTATSPDPDTLAIVGVPDADDTFLTRVSRSAGVGALKIVTQPSGESWRAYLSFSDGARDTFFEWSPDRPGDRTVGTLGSFLVSFAAIFAGLIAVHTTSRLADNEARAAKMAGHDLLTGIPNRMLFSQLVDAEIGRADRHGGAMGLMFLDLDRFKEINDTFGHDAGDCVIIAATKRIAALLRTGDVLARFGGDEFAILQPDADSPHECEVLARRILEAMREPFDVGSQKATIGASIGIAMCPQNGRDTGELMRLADVALYRAKNSGRNRFCFFEEQMNEELRVRKSAEDELRTAIETNALDVYYQPIMAPDGRTILSLEALARWIHPLRGPIDTEHFVRLAEDRGLALQLGDWVLRRVCRDAANWALPVSINVSALQIRQHGFSKSVLSTIRELNFDINRLQFEITEAALMADPDHVENEIVALRTAGIQMTLDDFGTGQMSLIYLRRFAFDKIKIDDSFLCSVESTGESAIIIQTIAHFARALGLTVVAEGVETDQQFELVRAAGCGEMQGFYFSPAVPAPKINDMLRNGLRRAA